MKKLMIKFGTGFAAASLLMGSLASSAFAANVTISGNGAGSSNTATTSSHCTTNITQNNSTSVSTEAIVVANSGGNEASGNTTGGGGGDVGISTGAASASLGVSVTGGNNDATGAPNCCDCQNSQTAVISGNGAGSFNSVNDTQTNTTNITQKNKTRVWTRAVVISNSGKNRTNGNTTGGGGGSVGVTTGPTTAALGVSVTSSSNSL